MPLILFMMIGMPVLSMNHAYHARKDTKAPSTQKPLPLFNEGNEEYEELIAPYNWEENV